MDVIVNVPHRSTVHHAHLKHELLMFDDTNVILADVCHIM